ncbi:hypothetical protein [Alicyclobacillus kakegawensis]|uniref:hypothetical protein n=1 Tax=Alicyclobacillus kakegawensis TaxID=392012 RepID=UPI0008364AD3|nr:hypothetical protein [Alicyclobacillus kakegawensis]
MKAYQRDLEEEGAISDLGQFDNIIAIHFEPPLHTFQQMCGMLRRNGISLMTLFNVRQHAERNFPQDAAMRNVSLSR